MSDEELPAVVPAGDGEGPLLGDWDMRERGDLSKLAEAIRRGWQVTPERKQAYFAALDQVVREIDLIKDIEKRAAAIASVNKVLQMEQASALKDLHRREEQKRLDDGKATARVDQQHTHTHTIDYDAIRRRLDDLDSRRAAPDAARDG